MKKQILTGLLIVALSMRSIVIAMDPEAIRRNQDKSQSPIGSKDWLGLQLKALARPAMLIGGVPLYVYCRDLIRDPREISPFTLLSLALYTKITYDTYNEGLNEAYEKAQNPLVFGKKSDL